MELIILAILFLLFLVLPGVPFTGIIFLIEEIIFRRNLSGKLINFRALDLDGFLIVSILVGIPVTISTITFLFYLGFIYLPSIWIFSYLGCWGIVLKMSKG